MAHTISAVAAPAVILRAYGRTIEISGSDEAVTKARNQLTVNYRNGVGPAERAWNIREDHGSSWIASVEGALLSGWPNVETAVEAVLSDLELWVAEHAKRSIFVHAGCVVVDGRAIVLPGRSLSGKSSLTAALVRAGAIYYSDEYAVLDHRGLVRPYARPLAMRPYDGGSVVRVSIEDLGGRLGRGPAPVGLIADLHFDPVAGWRTGPITRGQAMIRLFDNTVAARSRPQAALSALEHATENATAIAGSRGDADATAQHLLALLKA
jgi:hypothetical protein